MKNKRLDYSIKKIRSVDAEIYKKDKKAFTRNRKMGFKDYIWYLIYQK